MRSVLVHQGNETRWAETVDPAWLAPGAPQTVWVNIDSPTEGDRPLLEDVFHFHELAVEDALAAKHHPKIESYDGFLYLILHEIVPFEDVRGAKTEDIDFFLTRN